MKILLTLILILINSISYGQTTVIMTQKYGVYFIPCKVNGLSLDFIFDTGASDVTISDLEANKMRENGFLKEDEILGTGNYTTANGDMVVGTKIILRTLQIGGKTLYNVNASIVHTEDAPLLLGQSALQKFGKFSVDYESGILTLGGNMNDVSNNNVISFREYMQRGYIKNQLGDYYGAITNLTNAIEINPNNPYAYYLRSRSKNNLGASNDAISDLTKAIQLKSNFYEAYYMRGLIKSGNEDYYGAISDFSSCILESPNDNSEDESYVYLYRGISKYSIKDYSGAIADYNTSIYLNPTNGNCYYFRGSAKYSIKDINGACSDWNKADMLGNKNAIEFINQICH